MAVSISFTGKVERVKEWDDDSRTIDVKVDDGSKYGGRARISTKQAVNQGDTVSVTTEKMPYPKVREYTNRDGERKTAADLVYAYAEVEVTGAVEYGEADIDSEIPF